MRKNRMMRAASALMVAVLLTTSTISGTFAKYVTEAEAKDEARVAKWGVTITANGSTFADQYDTHDPAFTGVYAKSVISSVVDENVVAPGTSGHMAHMTLTGTPEVAVKVTYEAEFDLNDEWIVDGDFYCPLKICVEGTYVNGLDYTDKADFEAAVEALINGWTKSYAAGTDLSTVEDDSVSVYWEWPFSTSDANDVKDTKLGDKAVANPITVSLKITTTVTQID